MEFRLGQKIKSHVGKTGYSTIYGVIYEKRDFAQTALQHPSLYAGYFSPNGTIRDMFRYEYVICPADATQERRLIWGFQIEPATDEEFPDDPTSRYVIAHAPRPEALNRRGAAIMAHSRAHGVTGNALHTYGKLATKNNGHSRKSRTKKRATRKYRR